MTLKLFRVKSETSVGVPFGRADCNFHILTTRGAPLPLSPIRYHRPSHISRQRTRYHTRGVWVLPRGWPGARPNNW